MYGFFIFRPNILMEFVRFLQIRKYGEGCAGSNKISYICALGKGI
jgi:hypothetical protein